MRWAKLQASDLGGTTNDGGGGSIFQADRGQEFRENAAKRTPPPPPPIPARQFAREVFVCLRNITSDEGKCEEALHFRSARLSVKHKAYTLSLGVDHTIPMQASTIPSPILPNSLLPEQNLPECGGKQCNPMITCPLLRARMRILSETLASYLTD